MSATTATDPDAPVSYGRRLHDLAVADPDGIAIHFQALDGSERDVTWHTLDERSNQMARAMEADGVVAGSRVAAEIQNSPELVEVIAAAWKLGAVPVPMRWDLPEWERDRLLEVIDPALTIGPSQLELLEKSRDLPSGPLPDVTPAQTHGICSSGSTGLPKVILIDRPGVWVPMAAEPFVSPWGPIPRPQVILTPAPLYHTNGFSVLLGLVSGDTLVLLEKFDAERIVDLIERYKVSTFTATPTMLQRIARVPGVGGRDFSSIRWILQGAAVIPQNLVRFWLDLVGPEKFFMAYGMTEGLGLTALRGDEWLGHPGSVGKGFRGTEVRIAGPDGELLPPGEIGEIYLRSQLGGSYRYLGGADMLPVTDDGFGTAGDLGWLDEDGYLYIADRRVDMIISGGANVYPAEVESALFEHPGIADVVVIGLADTEWGRRIHAVVEPADLKSPPTEAEVIAFARERLAAYKVPKSVEIIDAMPRTAATKVSRTGLVADRGG